MYFCYFLSGIIFNYWWVIPSHNVNIDIDYFYKWITWNCHLNYRDWKIIWNTRLEIEKGINKKGEKKKIEGGTRIWTMDLSICSRLLYHWAIPPHLLKSALNAVLKQAAYVRNDVTLHICTLVTFEVFYKNMFLT